MSENLKELLRFSLKEWYDCSDEKYSKTLGKIVDSVLSVAHENGWEQEVSQILNEFP